MAEFRSRLPDIRAAGGDLAFVGTGQPRFARGFRELLQLDPGVPILSDEQAESYRLAGFRRGFFRTIAFGALPHYLRALGKGHRQGRTQGDPWQQGGALVIAPDGTLAYRYASRVGGDHPPPDEVLAALGALSPP